MREKVKNPSSLDERLTAAFATLAVNINNLQTFHQTTKDLLETGAHLVEEKFLRIGKQELNNPEWQELLAMKELAEYEEFGLSERALRATAKRAGRISKQVADSAAIVFAHTILDGILSECCHISFQAAPSDWYQFVSKRKIELGEIQNGKVDELMRQKGLDFVREKERESMSARLSLLHQVCAPKFSGKKLVTAWIQESHLNAFDETRHEVVHKQKFADKKAAVEEQLMFAGLVGFSALGLVGRAYGLQAGGILDKETSNPKEIWLKLSSGIRDDFPEAQELLEKDLPRILDLVHKWRSEVQP